MLRLLLYVLAFVFSFALFMVVFAPASSLWVLVKGDAQKRLPDLTVLTVDGSVWNGEADLRFRAFPTSQLAWQISPTALLRQQLDIDTSVHGEGHALESAATVTRTSALISLEGFLDHNFVNPMSRRYGMSFPGQLTIREVDLTTDLKWLTSASGQLHWSGGNVRIDSRDGTANYLLPPLDGDLSLAGDNLLLTVRHQRDTVIVVRLTRSGWAAVTVRGRLLQLAGLPYPPGTDPDFAVISLEEKLF